jgi:hypothetical protein
MLDDRIACNQFAVTMLEKLDEDNEFLRKNMFSSELSFHVSGNTVNRNSPEVNAWRSPLIRLPSFAVYLEVLEHFVYP